MNIIMIRVRIMALAGAGFLLVAFIGSWVLSASQRQTLQRQKAHLQELQIQKNIQIKLLNRNFLEVQPRDGKVLIVLSERGMPMQIPGSPPKVFDKQMLLASGTKFEIGDSHFFLKYLISRIETDGVTIDFDADGGVQSPVRRSQGSIKLGWK